MFPLDLRSTNQLSATTKKSPRLSRSGLSSATTGVLRERLLGVEERVKILGAAATRSAQRKSGNDVLGDGNVNNDVIVCRNALAHAAVRDIVQAPC